MKNLLSVVLVCILTQAGCSGSKGSDGSSLLLVGMAGSPAPVSPSSSSGSAAPSQVSGSAIEMWSTELAGVTPYKIACHPSPWGPAANFGACVVRYNYQSADSPAHIVYIPHNKPQVYPGHPVSYDDEWVADVCKNYSLAAGGNEIYIPERGKVTLPLAPELNALLRDYCPPVVVNNAPMVPAPPEPVADFALDRVALYPYEGKHLPEYGITLFFNQSIRCSSSLVGEVVGLWKRNSDGSFSQVQTRINCGVSSMHLGPGVYDDAIRQAKFDSGDFSGLLNGSAFEPNTTYRVLVSPALQAQSGTLLGDTNALGDISGTPNSFLGTEFTTAAAPCYPSYYEATQGGYGHGVCHFMRHFSAYAPGQVAPVTPRDYSRALGSGPAFDVVDPADKSCNQLRPTLVERLNPGTWNIMPAVGDSWETPMFPAGSNSAYPPVALCIHHPGEPNEFTEAIVADAVDLNTAQQNCDRFVRIRSEPIDPDQEYPNTSLYLGTESQYWYANNAFRCNTQQQTPPPTTECLNKITVDTTQGRWFETPATEIQTASGKTLKVKGIHSFWDYEKLYVRVRGNCKPGWYNLKITAMNHGGPLPAWYKAFYVSVRNERDEKNYGLSIPASGEAYSSATVPVWIDSGDSDLQVKWTNDAYLTDVYDANLQIKSITLAAMKGIPPAPASTAKAGKFCEMIGRFYGDTKIIFANDPGGISAYCFEDMISGKYEVAIKGRSHGKLPATFKSFDLRVFGDGVEGRASIPASETKSQVGKTTLDLRRGDKKLNVAWANPETATEGLSLQIESITITRVGDSQRSDLSAFFLQNTPSKGIIWLALALVVVSAGGIVLLKRIRRA
ncbi:MAG: hypothetical protein JNM27_23140 [Leptospirales bacterium]|nr:hypothetical protein [Leptospirales bacterium]